jgi:hypothetical protein
MAQQRATLYRDFDGKFENLKYKKPSKTKAKTQVVYFNYGARNLRIQLATKEEPPIRAPFGITKFVAEDASEEDRKKAENDPRQNCDLSLGNSDLLKFFQDLDEHNINVAIQNKATWFPTKKDIKDDVIRDNYKRCVAIEESYAPRLRAKVNMSSVKVLDFIPPTGEGDTGAFRPGKIEEWKKKPFDCIPICEPNAIWFQSGSSWGCTVMVTDLLIFPPIQRPEFGFTWGGEKPPRNINEAPAEVAEVAEVAEPRANCKRSREDEDEGEGDEQDCDNGNEIAAQN